MEFSVTFTPKNQMIVTFERNALKMRFCIQRILFVCICCDHFSYQDAFVKKRKSFVRQVKGINAERKVKEKVSLNRSEGLIHGLNIDIKRLLVWKERHDSFGITIFISSFLLLCRHCLHIPVSGSDDTDADILITKGIELVVEGITIAS